MGRSPRPLLLGLALLFLLFLLNPSIISWHLLDSTIAGVHTEASIVKMRMARKPGFLSKSTKLAEHEPLVLGPAAGHGLPGRTQCQDTGLQETPQKTRPESCGLAHDEVVTIVTMFVGSFQPTHTRTAWLQPGGDVVAAARKRLSLLNVFLQSVEVSMPGSRTVVISDPNSDFELDSLPPRTVVKYIHGNYTRSNLMLQRLESYIAFLKLMLEQEGKQSSTVHVIFADSDMIVVDNLGCAFTNYSSWHVALTFRNNRKQPINSGVLMVRGTREGLTRGKAFLTNVVRVYKAKFSGNARMIGDQLAFAWVLKAFSTVDADRFKKPETFTADVLDTDILFLPCLCYNWTPAEGAGQFHGMPEDVKVLHFKGSTKRLMLEAWKVYLSDPSKDFTDMKCLILKSGRAKYEF